MIIDFFFASRQELISFRLTAIHASRRYRFFLCLTARIDFIPPDGDSRLTAISIFLCLTARIDFLCLTAIHASRRYRFFLCLTEKIDFFPPDGDLCITAILIFLCLTARIGFIRLTAIHTSRRYSFGLTAAPHHGNIPLALQPRPITAILLRPYSRAPSRRYSFGLTAMPHHGDIPLALQPCPIHGDIFFGLAATPHGDINFLFTSRRLSIFLCLSARINFIPPYGDSRLTAIIDFFFASRQESISFRLMAIHTSRQ